jgi:hypothetical protein
MNGTQAAERPLQTVGERLVGEVHVGEQRVAAFLGHFAREQDRAHGGFGVVAVVGVPAAADVGLLLLLLAHLGDFRIARRRHEELVDVDRSPAARERDVLLGRQLLVAKEDHAFVVEDAAKLVPLVIAEVLRQIDAEHFGAAAAGEFPHGDRFVCHRDALPFCLCCLLLIACKQRGTTPPDCYMNMNSDSN